MIVETEFNFAQKLKSVRESRGLQQKDLGAIMGIDPNRISNWELGYSYPQLAAFRELCIALNCPPGDLLGLGRTPLSASEHILIKRFREVDDHDRETLLTMAETLLRRHQ